MGSWMSYGLGSLNNNLPSFVVLLSNGTGRPKGQPLYSRLVGKWIFKFTYIKEFNLDPQKIQFFT